MSAQEEDSKNKVIVGSEFLGSRNLPPGILYGYHFQPKMSLVYFKAFHLAPKVPLRCAWPKDFQFDIISEISCFY